MQIKLFMCGEFTVPKIYYKRHSKTYHVQPVSNCVQLI